MKITTEDLGSRQVMLTLEVDAERVDRALRIAARHVSRNYNIPGFRRGRAPFHVVLQRFGREALLQEALDDLGQEVIAEAIESEGLEPYDAATLEDMELDPLTFKLRVPLRPTVDLGDYRQLRVDPPVVNVQEEEIAAELERLRQANAILEPVGDRTAQMGDWVLLDLSADVDGESLVDKEGYDMVLDPEEVEFERGFAEQIVGMNGDEEKQFTLTLSDDWGEEKAGKEATFLVTLRGLRGRLLPDLDDDLARTVGDFDTLEELRQDIRDQFQEDAQRRADSEYTEQVIKALVTEATLDYPPDIIEDQIDTLIEDIETRLESQGLPFDDYLKLSGQTEDEFRESVRPRAERIVHRGLVLGELVREEKLDVEGAEIDEFIAALSKGWGDSADEAQQALTSPESVRSIVSSLLTSKVVERLVAIAKGEAPPIEELEQDTPEDEETALIDVERLTEDAAEAGGTATLAEEMETPTIGAEETPGANEDASSETE